MAHAYAIADQAALQRVDEHAVSRWEKALAIAGLLIFVGAFRVVLLNAADSDRTGGSALFQLVSGGIYLSAITVLVARGIPTWALQVLRQAWPLVLLTLLTPLSVLWSQAPEVTLRRAIALLLSSAFAIFLLVRFNLRTVFNLVVIAFAIFIALSILAAAVPGLGITPSGAYAGAWRGLTGQKNVFGRTVGLAVVLLPLAYALRLTDWRKLALLMTPVALLLLLLSRSATSLVTVVGSFGIGAMLYASLGGSFGRWRLRPELGLTLLLAVAVTVFLVVTYGWTTSLEALGRDPTLTGRTKLWNWAIGINVEAGRELLGSGYRAFWIDANTKYFFEFFAWAQSLDGTRSETFSGPDHAHSGYVDTYLQLGLVGVSVLAVTVFSAGINLRRALSKGILDIGFIFAVILGFVLVYAITEKSLLQQSEDLWLFFIFAYLALIKETLLRNTLVPLQKNLGSRNKISWR